MEQIGGSRYSTNDIINEYYVKFWKYCSFLLKTSVEKSRSKKILENVCLLFLRNLTYKNWREKLVGTLAKYVNYRS
jgi:hypothetical protein